MKYRLVFDDQLEKDSADLPKPIRERQLAKLAALAEDPRPPSAKPIAWDLHGYWSLRVRRYRASYTIDDSSRVVHVWNAGHRSRFCERVRRRRTP